MPTDNNQHRPRPVARDGAPHAAVRPHRTDQPSSGSATAPSSPKKLDLDKLIANWSQAEGASTYETYWGDKLSRKEEAARTYFAIPKKERVHLVLDTTILGSCKIGLALCDGGIWMRDESKVQLDIPWTEFGSTTIELDGDNLMLDGSKFISSDGRRLYPLLATIRKQL